MQLTRLWPHVLLLGRTPYQLVCKPLWRSPRSNCWYDFSWCLWWSSSNEWTTVVAPPPRIHSESRRYGFNCLTGQNIPSDSDGMRCAIPGTEIHFGACDSSWFLARNPASGKQRHHQLTLDVSSQKHTCHERHSKHVDMNIISPKPKLTGTLFSWSAIIVEGRHWRFLIDHRPPRRTADSSMPKVRDEGPTWAWFFVALVVQA